MTMTGKCYCGAVQYEAQGDINEQQSIACWCQTCIRLHSIGSLNVKSSPDAVKITKGQPTVFEDKSSDSGKTVHRSFCGACSSPLYSVPDAMPGVIFLKAGSLDDSAKLKPSAEIYVESALNGVGLKADGIKRFEGMMAKEI